MATSSNHRQVSTRRANSDQKWNRIKPDLLRMYIQEEMNMKDIFPVIEASHGVALKRKQVFNKLKEWGCRKNIKSCDMQWIIAKRAQRALGGKKTNFFYGNRPVSTDQIDRAKKRGTMRVPMSISTPERIAYNTPSPESEPLFPQNIHNEWEAHPSSQSPSTSFYRPDSGASSLVRTCNSQMSQAESPQEVKFDVPEISMLERYLSDEVDLLPWLRPSSGLYDHGMILAKQQEMCEQISGVLGHRYGEIDPPEICCNGNHFLLDPQTAIEDSDFSREQMKDDAESKLLQDILEIEVTLATRQRIYGETAPQTLKKRFELAKAFGRSGNHEEVEYHCREILNIHPQIDVQTFLGMRFANASRIDDATLLLFAALAEFIIQFHLSSIQVNDLFFRLIEELFTELSRLDDDRWSSLTLCLIKMMNTIGEANLTDALDLLSSQLFLCGFSFANECATLGFIDSAMYLYRRLFEYSPTHSYTYRYEIEKAKAHRRYGLLLRQQNDWRSSAMQLELAYKSLMSSEIQDYQLIAILETDFKELIVHRASHLHEESSLVKRLGDFVTHYLGQDLSRVQRHSAAMQTLSIAHYLSSDDLPIPIFTIEPSATVHFTGFGLHERDTEISPRSEYHTSTGSMSTSMSHEFGKTFTAGSVSSFVSNRCHMVPSL